LLTQRFIKSTCRAHRFRKFHQALERCHKSSVFPETGGEFTFWHKILHRNAKLELTAGLGSVTFCGSQFSFLKVAECWASGRGCRRRLGLRFTDLVSFAMLGSLPGQVISATT